MAVELGLTFIPASFVSVSKLYWSSRRKNGNVTPSRSLSMTWASPNWRWGYTIGDAHDAAKEMREKLAGRDDRMVFLERLAVDDGDLMSVDVEQMKLCLALRFQRIKQKKFGEEALAIMQSMAECKYESKEGENELKNDLLELISATGWDVDKNSSLKHIGRAALIATEFVQEGL